MAVIVTQRKCRWMHMLNQGGHHPAREPEVHVASGGAGQHLQIDPHHPGQQLHQAHR